jgi:hypothetical protein
VNAQRGFDASFAAAELSDAPRAGLRMGASLWVGARLLSVGSNRWHSHPASDNNGFNRSLHAEHVAILRRQHYDLPSGRLTMYVARRLADGTVGDSRPCANCLRLLRIAEVRRVWFYEAGVQRELVL